MNETLLTRKEKTSIPVWLLQSADLIEMPDAFPEHYSSWLKTVDFKASPGETSIIRLVDGQVSAVLFGLGDGQKKNGAEARSAMNIGKLARTLPAGNYHLENCPDGWENLAALSWLLGGYKFDRYLSGEKNKNSDKPMLAAPESCNIKEILSIADSVCHTRDLINTPTNDLGPEQLEQAFRMLGDRFKAKMSVIKGDDL